MINDELKNGAQPSELLKSVIEYNDESCSWCANEDDCPNHKKSMEYTREAIKNVSYCSKAYCSCKCTCDYYQKDNAKYNKYHYGECSK